MWFKRRDDYLAEYPVFNMADVVVKLEPPVVDSIGVDAPPEDTGVPPAEARVRTRATSAAEQGKKDRAQVAAPQGVFSRMVAPSAQEFGT